MSRRLSLPPRRAVPPPPNANAESIEVPDEAPKGIAARIASLQLEQGARHPLGKPPPPPPPRRQTSIQSPLPIREAETEAETAHFTGLVSDESSSTQIHAFRAPQPSRAELIARGPDYMRAISRKPPPPPVQLEYVDEEPAVQAWQTPSQELSEYLVS